MALDYCDRDQGVLDADLNFSEDDFVALEAQFIDERRRETAIEHLLLKTIAYVEARQPGLLDTLGTGLRQLRDPTNDETRDDEAVRAIARRMIAGARRAR